MWGIRMVSEDYLGLNDQLDLAVSHSNCHRGVHPKSSEMANLQQCEIIPFVSG